MITFHDLITKTISSLRNDFITYFFSCLKLPFFWFFFTLPVLSCENNCDCFLSHGIKVWISKSCRKAGGLDITFRTFSYVFDILKDEKGDKRSPHPLSINSFKLTPFFSLFLLTLLASEINTASR